MPPAPPAAPARARPAPDWRLDLAVLTLVTLAASLPFWVTDLDLRWQAFFFRPGPHGDPWPLRHALLWRVLNLAGPWPGVLTALAAAVVAVGAAFRPAWRRWRPHALLAVYAMVLGPGLLANALLKDHWGRPRPEQTEQFGGPWKYQKPLVKGPSGRGKSFPCGHSSAAFYLAVLFLVYRRRRPRLARGCLAAALALGALVGVARMAAGAHYASDVVWSAFWALLPALLLYHFVLRLPLAEDDPDPARHAHWGWTLGALAAAAAVLAGALFVVQPVYADVRYARDAPAAGAGRAVLAVEVPGPLSVRFAPLPGEAFRLSGVARGVGLPHARVFHAVESERPSDWFVRVIRHGYFHEFAASFDVVVDPAAVGRLTLLLREGDLRLAGLEAPGRPDLEIALDSGELRVADSDLAAAGAVPLSGPGRRYRIPASPQGEPTP
jgi:membrane-associated PAP2 superfamily phosphatase